MLHEHLIINIVNYAKRVGYNIFLNLFAHLLKTKVKRNKGICHMTDYPKKFPINKVNKS